jgi:hypothetical protein
MCGRRTDHAATVVITGFAFMQNLRRGHYEIPSQDALASAASFPTPAHQLPSAADEISDWDNAPDRRCQLSAHWGASQRAGGG